MVVIKRKKQSRMRGRNSQGYGAKKKHRGSGNRGGCGNAGTGKRGDAKKPSVWKPKGHKYLGKYGFKNAESMPVISIRTIEENFFSMVKAGKIVEKSGVFNVNAEDRKLLSEGKPTRKYNINVCSASQSAIEKIKAAGGSVSVKA